MDTVFQTAITGYGKSAQIFHIPLLNLHKGFILRSVLLPKTSTTKVHEKDVMVVRSLKELLKDDKVDLVVITSPNRFHFEQAKEALSADKHVVVEKPLSVTSEEAEKLIRLAKSKGKILTVFHNRRKDSDFLTLKDVLNQEKTGKSVEVISNFLRFRNALRDGHWKERDEPGSGILYDISPHLIDQALILFGKPESVTAGIHNQRGGSTDDAFWLKLAYQREPPLEVTLKAGMLAADQAHRFIVRGTQASLVINGLDAQESALSEGQTLSEAVRTELSQQQKATLFNENRNEPEAVEMIPGNYPWFYDDLYYSLQKKGEPPVDPETALAGLKIIEAAIESNKTGNKIHLNW
jgi:predicted dehydrogenase